MAVLLPLLHAYGWGTLVDYTGCHATASFPRRATMSFPRLWPSPGSRRSHRTFLVPAGPFSTPIGTTRPPSDVADSFARHVPYLYSTYAPTSQLFHRTGLHSRLALLGRSPTLREPTKGLYAFGRLHAACLKMLTRGARLLLLFAFFDACAASLCIIVYFATMRCALFGYPPYLRRRRHRPTRDARHGNDAHRQSRKCSRT